MTIAERPRGVRSYRFPPYSRARRLLAVFGGLPDRAVTALSEALRAQRGSLQRPVNWADPDAWIAERLAGEQRDLARTIWEGSDRTVNPRYMHQTYRFVKAHGLIAVGGDGTYHATARGQAFRDGDTSVAREIDEAEGVPRLLELLAARGRAQRSDLLPQWDAYLREHSRVDAPSTIRHSLHARLDNLTERELVRREGSSYEVTPEGLAYLGVAAPPAASAPAPAQTSAEPRAGVLTAVAAYNSAQRAALRERLATIAPHRFERLVGDLLEAMGYEDVTVTRESGDRGIDVVATIQFGITTIKEVVQVKRQQGTIGRPVLDQLRGVLPLHGALRGTIITVGEFSRGCLDAALYPGAAPIGLIDGEKLLDLLVEHEIGVRKQALELHELDEDVFAGPRDAALAQESVDEEEAGR